MSILASEIMDKAAALLNDTAKQVYTYPVQLPYLTMALQDLRKRMELNNSPVTNETSAVITVPIGQEVIGFRPTVPVVGVAYLPDDLVEIQGLHESHTGQFGWGTLGDKKEFIPLGLTPTNSFGMWAWMGNEIRLPPANQINDLRIDYIQELFRTVNDETDIIEVVNADSYLQYRTAAILAEFIGENPTRAMALNYQAEEAIAIMFAIDNKGKQYNPVRRRPFRANYKTYGY